MHVTFLFSLFSISSLDDPVIEWVCSIGLITADFRQKQFVIAKARGGMFRR